MLLSKTKSFLKNLKGLKKKGGRNSFGRITVRTKGGGHKRHYRFIDWSKSFKESIVVGLEYDPNRTAYILKLKPLNDISNNFYYMIAPTKSNIFDIINNYEKKNDILNKFIVKKNGDSFVLADLEIGESIYNIEQYPGQGAVFARSAGTFGQIIQKMTKKSGYGIIKMPSKEQRYIPLNSKVNIGQVSNEFHNFKNIGKAGRSRWLNKRPTVRGVAMNPIDHPHGGRTKGGRPSVTPSAWPTKGSPTRRRKKNNFYVYSSRKSNKIDN